MPTLICQNNQEGPHCLFSFLFLHGWLSVNTCRRGYLIINYYPWLKKRHHWYSSCIPLNIVDPAVILKVILSCSSIFNTFKMSELYFIRATVIQPFVSVFFSTINNIPPLMHVLYEFLPSIKMEWHSLVWVVFQYLLI